MGASLLELDFLENTRVVGLQATSSRVLDFLVREGFGLVGISLRALDFLENTREEVELVGLSSVRVLDFPEFTRLRLEFVAISLCALDFLENTR